MIVNYFPYFHIDYFSYKDLTQFLFDATILFYLMERKNYLYYIKLLIYVWNGKKRILKIL